MCIFCLSDVYIVLLLPDETLEQVESVAIAQGILA